MVGGVRAEREDGIDAGTHAVASRGPGGVEDLRTDMTPRPALSPQPQDQSVEQALQVVG